MKSRGIVIAAFLTAIVGCSSSPETPATTAPSPSAAGANASKPADHMPADAKAAMQAGQAAAGR